MKLLPLLVLSAIVSIQGACLAANQVAPEPVVNNPAPRQTVWEETITAATNSRYWSSLAERAYNHEWWLSFWSISLGVTSIALPLVVQVWSKKKIWTAVSTAVSLIAFGVTAFFAVQKAAGYNDLATLQRRWQSLETDWQQLLRDRDSIAPEMLRARTDTLLSQKRGIEGTEPPETDHAAMHAAWLAEMHYRNVDPKWLAENEKNRQANPATRPN
jgi:hypothetical protein